MAKNKTEIHVTTVFDGEIDVSSLEKQNKILYTFLNRSYHQEAVE